MPDVVSLVGASWIWNGYAGTLDALIKRVKPGGLIVLGEPYWAVDKPSPEYCDREKFTADQFLSLAGLHDAFVARGLRLVRMHGSSQQDWDRYEMLQSLAIDQWAEANPEHEDRAELLEERQRENGTFLRWGRDQLGFATFVLRAPA